jgi:glutamyl-Q tRNA(Asp) synthetase
MQERRKLCNLVSLQALKVNRAVTIAREPAFRFAPSPNGLLHLGHAYSAIQTYEMAQKYAGALYLRIEDIDKARSQESFSAAILRDLHWLGIEWKQPVLYQSDNFEHYTNTMEKLNQLGLLYPCFASRKQIKESLTKHRTIQSDPDGAPLYPAIYKDYPEEKAKERILSGEPYALRLHMDRAITRAKKIEREAGRGLVYQSIDQGGQLSSVPLAAERWGDVVIKRKDIPTSYHLSVVIDDHNLGITHICRGKDLEAATDIHRICK